jgi:hypothetical protein
VIHIGWFSVAGLVADIVGFSILAYDLLPEYRVYRWRALNKILHEPSGRRIAAIRGIQKEPLHELAALEIQMQHISPLNSLRRSVGLPSIDFRRTITEPTECLAASEREVVEAIDVASERLSNRLRPPLRLGILLVVAGFILQLLGQLGSMGLF